MSNPLLPPDHAENNRHHTHGHIYKNQAELLEDILGRGNGDPDMYPEPGEAAALKAQSQNKDTTLEPTNRTSTTQHNKNHTGRRKSE